MQDYGGYVGPLLKVIGGAGSVVTASRAANANAQQAIINSRMQANQISRKARQTVGGQVAMTAAAGLATSGTPLAVMMDTAREAELDRLTVLRGGKMLANQYRLEGSQKVAAGLMKMGTDFFQKDPTSILQDLLNKAVAANRSWTGGAANPWAPSVPAGTYSLSP